MPTTERRLFLVYILYDFDELPSIHLVWAINETAARNAIEFKHGGDLSAWVEEPESILNLADTIREFTPEVADAHWKETFEEDACDDDDPAREFLKFQALCEGHEIEEEED